MASPDTPVTVGVLALQGAFNEHTQLLRRASAILSSSTLSRPFTFLEVRTASELSHCDALIIPGGESTAISLVAQRSNLLEPLRNFVKVQRKPTWGTCAGLILLAESANRTKQGGQELIGGLDVRVNRNHFGRQVESFQAPINLSFLASSSSRESGSGNPSCADEDGNGKEEPFMAIFIRAPVVEKILPSMEGIQTEEAGKEETVVAPSKMSGDEVKDRVRGKEVEILGALPGRAKKLMDGGMAELDEEAGDIVAVRQGNVFGTSFHPELTNDPRIHVWWLEQVVRLLDESSVG